MEKYISQQFIQTFTPKESLPMYFHTVLHLSVRVGVCWVHQVNFKTS